MGIFHVEPKTSGQPVDQKTILVERQPEHAKKEAKSQFTRHIHLTGKFQNFLS